MVIKVTTVRDVIQTVDEPIAYSSFIQYDAELPEGQSMIAEGG